MNCGQYDVFISGPMNNWTIQNNFFDRPCSNQIGTGCAVAGGAISFSQDYANVIGQFNVFATPGPTRNSRSCPDSSPVVSGDTTSTAPSLEPSIAAPKQLDPHRKHRLWPRSCGTDTSAVGSPSLRVPKTAYRGGSLSAMYGVLSEKPPECVSLCTEEDANSLSDAVAPDQ